MEQQSVEDLRLDRRPDRQPDRQPDAFEAERLSRRFLATNPERTRHTAAVAARAASLAGAVDDGDVNLLVAAAWVHDIGYSQALRETGFHPLDGARFLKALGWDARLCSLVAHHSGSRFIAEVTGLEPALREFAFVQDAVSDALTIADQTVGPNGRRLTLDERLHDMLGRHGPESPNARGHPRREAYFRATLQRVTDRLAASEAGASRPYSGPSGGSMPRPATPFLLPRARRSY